MKLSKTVQYQSLSIFGEIGRSPLCGNAGRPFFPGVASCRHGTGGVGAGQGASAPVAGFGGSDRAFRVRRAIRTLPFQSTRKVRKCWTTHKQQARQQM